MGKGKSGEGVVFWKGVAPKTWHAFFTTNEYFAAPSFPSLQQPVEAPCSLLHKQAINQQRLFLSGWRMFSAACSFAGTMIPVCMSDVQSGTYWHTCCLNEMLAERLQGWGLFSLPFSWEAFTWGWREINESTLFNQECLISLDISITAATDANVAVILIWENK